MCVAVIAFHAVPGHPLVIVSNRDEFHGRESARAHVWDDDPTVIAGRDLEKGGTWLGTTVTGRVALITNYRELDDTEYRKSRGHLVSDFLMSSHSASDYAEKSFDHGSDYAGYNLLLFDGESLAYVSNRSTKIEYPDQGVYGLSNHLLETPWPKVLRSKTAVSKYLEDNQALPVEDLIGTMRDTTIAPDEKLPSTGVPIELERALSSVFISGDRYGTRCTTVVSIGNEGQISLTEQTYRPNGVLDGRNTIIHQVS
ncbi:MAG: NRDE family protein [Rhodothermales bacterium]|nr:NRDE family protein [Rhodothermales bacterium]